MGDFFDHILLPKNITDQFYTSWSTHYLELFPAITKPNRPSSKYRPMSVHLSSSENITKSLPDVLDSRCYVGEQVSRVGDNIDEFIRNNRRDIYRSSSTNDILDEGSDEILFEYSDHNKKKNRFSWYGVQNCISNGSRFILSPLHRKKYDLTPKSSETEYPEIKNDPKRL